jgi:hypothetical protein
MALFYNLEKRKATFFLIRKLVCPNKDKEIVRRVMIAKIFLSIGHNHAQNNLLELL